MRRIPFLLPLLVVMVTSLLLVSCGKKDPDILATYSDKQISLGDFLLAHGAITVFNRPPLLTYEDREKFLNTLINKEILLMEAEARGIQDEPSVKKAAARWELEYCVRALYKEVAEDGLEISLDDVKKHWIDTRSRIRARHIMVATPEAAQEIRTKLMEGGDFAALAREFSIDDATARLGGDLGFMDKKDGNSVITQMAFSLEVGEISKVLRSQDGFHIMEVMSVQPPDMEKFEDERHLAGSELRTNLRKVRWDNYLQEQLGVHQVQFDQEVVSWLNEKLPERGLVDFSWHEDVTDEEKAQVLVTWDSGSWTVDDFMESFSAEGGRGSLFQSPGGGVILRTMEADILNMVNLAEAKNRGIHEQDQVARQVTKKNQSDMLDILHARLTNDVVIEEEDVRERYEEIKGELITPETVEFRMINASDKDRINAAYARARRGEDFEKLAEEYNIAAMKESDGLFGPINRESIRLPGLQTALFDLLSAGEMSEVLEPPGRGFMIVKLISRKPEHPMTFDEAKAQIEAGLKSEKENEFLNEWLDKKRDELNVKIYPEVFNKLSEGEEGEAS